MKLILNLGKKVIPLFFLLIFLLTCIMVFFNSEDITQKLKHTLIKALEDELKEEVQIGGITLFPLNRVTLHQVQIGSDPHILAKADRVVVSFYLHDLIKGVEGIISGIKEINLINPVVYLIKDENGFALEKYLTRGQGKNANSGVFTPVIGITDGSIYYRDDQFDENLHDIYGKIQIKKGGIELNLKTCVKGLEDAILKAEGVITPAPDFKLSFSDISPELLQRYGIDLGEVSNLSGKAEGSVTIKTRTNGSLDYMGQLKLKDGKVVLKNYPLTLEKIVARITFNQGYAMIHDLKGQTIAGNISVKGQISNFLNPSLALTLETDGLETDKITELLVDYGVNMDEEIKGKVEGKIEIVGTTDNITVKGNMYSKEVTYNSLALKDINMTCRWQNNLITLKELILNVGDGKLGIYNGYFDFKDFDKFNYSMTIEMQKLDLEMLLKPFDGYDDLGGRVNGRVYLSGSGTRYDEITAIGSVEVKNGQFQIVPFDRLQANFWLSHGELGLSQAEYTSPYLITKLAGNINLGGNMDLTVEPSFVDLRWFGDQFSMPVGGSGTIEGQISGSIKNPCFEGEVKLNQGQLWEQSFDLLSGGVRIDKSELLLSKVLVNKGKNDFELTGKVDLLTEGLDLHVAITHSSLEALRTDLLDFMDVPFDITGDIKGDINLNGPWSNLRVTGDLIASNGVVMNQPYNKARLTFTWDNNDIFFDNFTVSYKNTVLKASGMLEDYKSINIEMDGTNFNLTDIQQIREHLPQIYGTANFKGKLTGDLNSPSFWGTISTDSISYNGVPVEQLSALLYFENGILQIKPMKIINSGSEYTIIGEVDFLDKLLSINIKNKDSRLSDILRYIGLPIRELDYLLRGEIRINGLLNRPIFEFDITMDDSQEGFLDLRGTYDFDRGMNLVLQGTTFHLSPSKAYIGLKEFDYTLDGKIKISGQLEKILADMDIILEDINRGQLKISGVYDQIDGFDLQVDGKDLDLTQIRELIPVNLDYSGKLNVRGALLGLPDKLNANLMMNVLEGSLNSYSIKSLEGELRIESGKNAILDHVLILPDSSRIIARGSISNFDKDPVFNLNIEMPDGNLALLPFVVPQIEVARGKGKSNFHLTGSVKNPLIEGEININSGFLQYKGVEPIDAIDGKIILEKGRVIVEKLNAKYGKGRVNAQGRMQLNGLMPEDIILFVKCQDFHFKYGSVDALGDGDLRITGKLMQPQIRGEFIVHDATIKVLPTFDWPSSGGSSDFAPTFYLELYPGENVRVTGESPLNMSITLSKSDTDKLIIDTTDKELIMTGDLYARSGTFNIYNSNFRVTSASASFIKFNKYIPIIRVNANTVIGDYRIFVELDGLPTDSENFNWKLTSDPPLTTEQITALLANQGGLGEFLKGSGDFTAMISDEIWRYINQGLRSEFLNRLEETIEKTFKLDAFYLDPVLWGDRKINVQIGKYLGDNFYVVYKRTFSQNPDQSIGFEYEIRSNVSLEGVYKDIGDYQISLKADIPF